MSKSEIVKYEGMQIEDVEPENYTTEQRRAAVYQRILDLGHPNLFNGQEKKRMAERCDVALRTIYNDIDKVKEHVAIHLGDNHIANAHFVFERAIEESVARGEWKDAVDIIKDQAEWLEDRGVISSEPDKVEVSWKDYVRSGEEPIEVESDG